VLAYAAGTVGRLRRAWGHSSPLVLAKLPVFTTAGPAARPTAGPAAPAKRAKSATLGRAAALVRAATVAEKGGLPLRGVRYWDPASSATTLLLQALGHCRLQGGLQVEPLLLIHVNLHVGRRRARRVHWQCPSRRQRVRQVLYRGAPRPHLDGTRPPRRREASTRVRKQVLWVLEVGGGCSRSGRAGRLLSAPEFAPPALPSCLSLRPAY
jgi:hypothetical protein